jgi:hypothetical protein
MAEDSNMTSVENTPEGDPALAREGNCMLLTLKEQHMLVPRNVVAEVIRFSFLRFNRDIHTGLEFFDWRGHSVPHLSNTVLGEKQEIECNEDTKVAVFHGLRNQQQLPYYGFTIARSPRLLRLSESDLEHIEDAKLHTGELMRVSMSHGEAFIPKVDYFENLIIELLNQQADKKRNGKNNGKHR